MHETFKADSAEVKVLEDQLLVDIFEKNVNVKVKINVTLVCIREVILRG